MRSALYWADCAIILTKNKTGSLKNGGRKKRSWIANDAKGFGYYYDLAKRRDNNFEKLFHKPTKRRPRKICLVDDMNLKKYF
jgi:hypothetical protein